MAIPEIVQTQLDRINEKLTECYAIISAKGGTVPTVKNTENLYNSILSIPNHTATFVITSETGASFSAKRGSKTIPATASGGTYTISGIDEYGDWVVTGTLSGTTISFTITVDEAKTYTQSCTFYVTITATAGSNGKVKIDSDAAGTNVSKRVLKGSTVVLTAVPDSDYNVDEWSDGSSGTTLTLSNVQADATYSVTFYKNSCVTGDSLVLMSDNTLKRVDEIKMFDMVKAWNFDTGELVVSPVVGLTNHGTDNHFVSILTFKDGYELKIVDNHALYNADENRFVVIDRHNASKYIGSKFIIFDENERKSVVLENVVIEEKEIIAYSLATAGEINVIINSLLVLSPSATFTCPFDINDDMKFDQDKKAADIETYGTMSFDEFNALYDTGMTEEQYYTLGGLYIPVAVGKGIDTLDNIANTARLLLKDSVDDV